MLGLVGEDPRDADHATTRERRSSQSGHCRWRAHPRAHPLRRRCGIRLSKSAPASLLMGCVRVSAHLLRCGHARMKSLRYARFRRDAGQRSGSDHGLAGVGSMGITDAAGSKGFAESPGFDGSAGLVSAGFTSNNLSSAGRMALKLSSLMT